MLSTRLRWSLRSSHKLIYIKTSFTTDAQSVQRTLACMSVQVFVSLSLCVHRCLLNCGSRKTCSSGRLHIDHAKGTPIKQAPILTAHSLIYQEHSLHYCHSHLTPVSDIHKVSHIPLVYPRRLKSAAAIAGGLDLNGQLRWTVKSFWLRN